MPSGNSRDKVSSVIRETILAASSSIQLNLESAEFTRSIRAAAELIRRSGNRVILTGMGKSGLIARKVAATLTSTGTPAVFLHPADALHGDVGNVQKKEVVLAYSNSGETREIVELLPHIRLLGGKLVAITQKRESTLAQRSDVAICYSITREGCPLELAPMASTTISLVIGDGLAAALIELKGFRAADFGKFHPSGALGRKLLTTVKDVMTPAAPVIVTRNISFRELLTVMVTSNLGCVIIRGSSGHLRGIITDGDIKRLLESHEGDLSGLMQTPAVEIMTANPRSVPENALLESALSVMHEFSIDVLPVTDSKSKPSGLVRMKDILNYGIR